MTTDRKDRPQPDTLKDRLPGLIDFWPKWEKNCYLMTRYASDMIRETTSVCPECREDRFCADHLEASHPESRRELERQIVITFCAREITCPRCQAGSTCPGHWRQGIRHLLAEVFPTVLEVAEETGANLFPHYDGYGLSKDRRAVLCWGTYVKYMIGSRVPDKYELAIGDLPREASKMKKWLDG